MLKYVLTILLFVFLISVSYSQESSKNIIILDDDKATIIELFNTITEKTGITFSYSSSVFDLGKVIVVKRGNPYTVQELLNVIFKDENVKYLFIKSNVIIKKEASPNSKKHTIHGYIRDASSGENLIGATLYSVFHGQGTVSNTYGFFSISFPEGDTQLSVSYVGYQPASIQLYLEKDTTINISLPSVILDEIVITASDENLNQGHDQAQISTISIPVSQLKSRPVLAGEVDIMKSLQLLPGVQGGMEGTSGLYIRGGSPDQNLILLDGVPVYNASHLLGFFSVFNADAINHVEIIKGGFPARYGGRLSSIVNISMKEGNNKEFEGEGSIGLIASKLTLEGPIKKNKSSFMISGRRTYLDLLTKPFVNKASGNEFGYYFSDFNAKLNYIFNDRSRIYLSTYMGNDKGYAKTRNSYTDTIASHTTIQNTDNSLKWGNITSALRWNHTLSPSLFLNIAATYSQYNFGISGEQTTTVTSSSDSSQIANLFSRIESVSGIKDYGLKADVDFISSNSHYIRFGGYGIQHHFKPGISSFNANEDVVSINPETIVTMEYGAYGEDDFSITSALKLNAGVHFSGLNVENTNYFFIQPRLTTSYLFNKNFSAKISYSYMTQYLHLLTNSGIGYPTDLWVPVTANIKPMISNQIVAGVSYLLGTKYHISVEGYYKAMDHVIEYKEGASFLNNKQGWESKVSVGNGESYGTEFFIEKKYGMWTGWIGYTLAWTYRQFYNINLEEIFPYRYDRRHDLEFTTSRSITKNIDFSANWVFGSGMPVTLPIAAFQTVGDYAAYDFYYGGRNSFRTRSYHRLDINFSFKKSKKYGERTWVVGLYNAYSRRNPFYTSVAYMTGEKARLEQYGIFPIFPSVSYNFKF